MRGFRFDWRWAALILFLALLANARMVPWPLIALTLGAAGGYLITMAWRAWGPGGRWGSGGDTRRVTYWRGQRIEAPGAPRRYRPVSWGELAPVLVYGLMGAALVLAALAVVLRNLSI